MKKTLLTFGVLCTMIAVQAQITLRQTNFALVGDTLFYGYDTTDVASSLSTSGGANKTWDFSTAVRNTTSEATFLPPNLSPVTPPPNITHVLVDGGINDVSFLNVNATGVETIVTNPAAAILGGEPFLGLKSISFPLTYLTRVRDTVSSKFVVAGSTLGLGQLFDSVRISYTVRLDNLTDGWGTLKTPTGTYNTLRVKSTTNITFKFEGKNNTLPFWVNIPISSLPFPIPENQTDVAYIWLSENGKYFLAEATMVTDDPLTQEEFRYQIPRPSSNGLINYAKNNTAVQVYPNPVNDLLTINFTLPQSQTLVAAIYDVTGKLVQQTTFQSVVGNNQLSLPTASLNNGLYTLRITGTGVLANAKIVVAH